MLWILAAGSLSAGNYFAGVTPATVTWTNGIVPYLFDTNYTVSAAQKNIIVAGLKEWELAANVKFIPRTNQALYVLVQYTNDGSGTGYYLSGTPGTMMLHGLSRGLVCHEAGHLFGLQHEHQRVDRNNYVVINTGNIAPGTDSAFSIDTSSITNGAYDLESVMHYGPGNFSAGPGLDSLDPLPPYQKYLHKIGNLALSIGDRAAVAHLYGLPVVPVGNIVTNTADGGLGSLRAAIYYANDHPGTTIRFNIPTSDAGYSNGVFTISLLGELPPLVSPGTIVDGTTQNGFSSRPLIVLDGAQAPPETGPVSGLHLYGTNCAVRALAFNNFSYSGVQFFCADATSNHVEGCYLGLKTDGTNAAPNFFAGTIFQFGAHDNTVGGIFATQRNIISGNTEYGVIINDTNSDRNIFLGNYLGLNAGGTAKLANGYSGIGIWNGPSGTIIGGTNAGARNVLSGNQQYGIYLSDSNVSGAVIQGNFIGTDFTGGNSIPNGDSTTNSFAGIGIFSGAHGNIIGGTSASARNIISGNTNAGIYLAGFGVTNNLVQGNYIGVNASGTGALARQQTGVFLLDGASGNVIGGTNIGARNVISGNSAYGIYISDPGTTNNSVQGNYLGTDFAGTNAVGNDIAIGVWNSAANNLIGGSTPGAGNIVSGNFSYGIAAGGVSGNVVQGNYIGPDISGKLSAPSTDQQGGIGIFGGSTSNLIGGTIPGAANLISGASGYGIFLADPGTSGNFVQGNLIGTDLTGTNALANSRAGVALFNGATGNFIGGIGAGAGNTIAFSGWAGVDIYDAPTTNNSIRGNFIFSNNYLGIDFNGDGVTPNDAGDGDGGPNNLQNFPIITNVFGYAASTVVLGKLNSAANKSFSIDVYRNFAADPSGNGQGRFYFGSVNVAADGSGNANFALTNSAGNFSGQYFAATATAAGGDTSEFGADLLATNQAAASAVFNGPYQARTNGFAFALTLQTNFSYRIQATTNLAANPVPWVNLTNFTATGAAFNFIDRSATNFNVRFYRVISP